MNQPSPYKRTLNLLLERETVAKLDHLHAVTGLSRNALAAAILSDHVKNVDLTQEEREKLKNEIEAAKLHR